AEYEGDSPPARILKEPVILRHRGGVRTRGRVQQGNRVVTTDCQRFAVRTKGQELLGLGSGHFSRPKLFSARQIEQRNGCAGCVRQQFASGVQHRGGSAGRLAWIAAAWNCVAE